MGRYVEIKKVSNHSGIHYYSVDSPDLQHVHPFYIAIDQKNRIINFYKNTIEEQPDFSIHADGDTSHVQKDWIPSFLLYATLKKARQALATNTFGEYISFQS